MPRKRVKYTDKTMPEIAGADTRKCSTWAKAWVDQLEWVVENGLPDCYRGNERAFISDQFGGGSPWAPKEYAVWAAFILRDERWDDLRKRFQRMYGFEFPNVVRDGIHGVPGESR